jgi:hypothetical protein
MAAGYHVDDLHAALREHQLVKSEELEYERRQGSPVVRRFLRVLFGASIGGTALGMAMAIQQWRLLGGRVSAAWSLRMFGVMDGPTASMLFLSIAGLAIGGVPLAGEYIRHKLSARIASGSISLWKSKWGARFAKIAAIGLKPADRPTLGMPVLTEIALGRATDHLFNALPKASRKELSALPETVRRLEGDATRLRESIDALDDQLSAFERGGDALDDARRTTLADELRAARTLAAERLAATVAALESIRLDLLRLQLGSAPIESVTATLDAARHIGDRIGESIAARLEVEKLLLDARTLTGALPLSSLDDDDADTPVHGVPTAHV